MSATAANPEAIRYNNTDQNTVMQGTWTAHEGPEFYSGDQYFSKQVDAYVEFAFEGTSICYIGAKSYNLGICAVYIDDEPTPTLVDAYSPTLIAKHPLFYRDELSPGQHTIKIVVTGDKNASATDSFVTIDAFDVNGDQQNAIDSSVLDNLIAYAKTHNGSDYTPASWSALQSALASAESLLDSPVTQAQINDEVVKLQQALDGLQAVTGVRIYNDADSNIKYDGTWTYYTGSEPFYKNDEHYSNGAGVSAELTFKGTSIKYIAATSSNLGMCDVYIDGALVKSDIDAYSPELKTQQTLFQKEGLPLEEHVIKIVVSGKKNPSSTDTHVTIDAFEVNDQVEPEPEPEPKPVVPPPVDATLIAPGNYYAMAINSSGALYSWGYGANYTLGTGTTSDVKTPKKIMDNVKTAAVGYVHSFAVKDNGALYAWGTNNYGQLGNGTTAVLKTPTKIMDNVIHIVAREYHSLAISTDGTLYAWGNNTNGQLGDGTKVSKTRPTKILGNVKSVSAGWFHTVALTEDGSVYTWGDNAVGQLGNGNKTSSLKPVKIMDNVKAIGAGWKSSYAITKDGKLYAWGANLSGQLGDNTYTSRTIPVKIMDNVKSVSGGLGHTLAITEDNKLYTWGSNSRGELGNGTGTSGKTPCKIMDNVKAAACGYQITFAVKDGALSGWGYNAYNQLGFSSGDYQTVPRVIMTGM